MVKNIEKIYIVYQHNCPKKKGRRLIYQVPLALILGYCSNIIQTEKFEQL